MKDSLFKKILQAIDSGEETTDSVSERFSLDQDDWDDFWDDIHDAIDDIDDVGGSSYDNETERMIIRVHHNVSDFDYYSVRKSPFQRLVNSKPEFVN